MLVFTRKKEEAIVIGDGIEIKVLRVAGETVRLGISAPTTVPVHRREVYDQIRAANMLAAAQAPQLRALVERLRGRATGDTDEHDSES